jgi:hypothetical protein
MASPHSSCRCSSRTRSQVCVRVCVCVHVSFCLLIAVCVYICVCICVSEMDGLLLSCRPLSRTRSRLCIRVCVCVGICVRECVGWPTCTYAADVEAGLTLKSAYVSLFVYVCICVSEMDGLLLSCRPLSRTRSRLWFCVTFLRTTRLIYE